MEGALFAGLEGLNDTEDGVTNLTAHKNIKAKLTHFFRAK